MLEDMTVPAHRDWRFVIEIQWAENGAVGDGGRTECWEIRCCLLYTSWVACMGRAMEDEGIDPALVERLLQAFFGVADWMRNREG